MQTPVLVESMALLVVAAAGIFLALLGGTALVSPPRARAFLLGFAATPWRHGLELVVRMAVGFSFIVASPRLPGSQVFFIAGAVLAGTTAILALLPYRVHLAFARRSVPAALPYLPVIAVVSLAAGLGVAWLACAAGVF